MHCFDQGTDVLIRVWMFLDVILSHITIHCFIDVFTKKQSTDPLSILSKKDTERYLFIEDLLYEFVNQNDLRIEETLKIQDLPTSIAASVWSPWFVRVKSQN